MIAASLAVQRPGDARLLSANASGELRHLPRTRFAGLLREGDVVIANDAATLPASLAGIHVSTGREIEVRLAARQSLDSSAIGQVSAVVFGEGDYRVRTEDRPAPPVLTPGDRLQLGPLTAAVVGLFDHPRFAAIQFEGCPHQIWEGISRHGKAIQYSHLTSPLALWDAWTPIAGPPVAFEPPSAGFVLSWSLLKDFAALGVRFATLTHAAGISSTGDAELDARLPFDEPYSIPPGTAALVNLARTEHRRVIAVGTSVVRALEHSALLDGWVHPGPGFATERIGPHSRLQVVDAILSGTHEPGASHYELLRAFATSETLSRMDTELNRGGYLTHEFGDSIFLERSIAMAPKQAAA